MAFGEHNPLSRMGDAAGAGTMLQTVGIDPVGPHEVEVQRFVKREKKAAN